MMHDMQAIENIIKNLPGEDPSVIELQRILHIKDLTIQEKGFKAWFSQYQKEGQNKAFLAPLAAYLALYMTGDIIPKAAAMLVPNLNLLHSLAATPLYIKSIPHRFTKSGFTGSPLKDQNMLYAQLAWLFVDWSKPNYQEQFWKILYPEIETVFGDIWPVYGQAILVKNKDGKFQNILINYAEVYKLAQIKQGFKKLQEDISFDTIKRICRFYPTHKEFWVKMQNDDDIPKSDYQNYFEFFTDLQKFLFNNRYTDDSTPDPITREVVTDGEITPTAQARFWTHYAPYLRSFMNHIDTGSDSERRKFDVSMRENDARLLDVATTLLNPPQAGYASCFDKNQQYLQRILANNERANLLQAIFVAPEIHYDKKLNKMGTDNLSSIPGASKVSANKDDLISFINEVFEAHDIRPDTTHWVAEYKRLLGNNAYKARSLYDFVYQIQDQDEKIKFLKLMLNDPLDFSLLLPDNLDEYKQYATKIIAENPVLVQEANGMKSASETSVNDGIVKSFKNLRLPVPMDFIFHCLALPDYESKSKEILSGQRSNELIGIFRDYLDERNETEADFQKTFRVMFMAIINRLDDGNAENFAAYYYEPLKKYYESRLGDIDKMLIEIVSFRKMFERYGNRNRFKALTPIIFELYINETTLLTFVQGFPGYSEDIYSVLKNKFPSVVKSKAGIDLIKKLYPNKPVDHDLITSYSTRPIPLSPVLMDALLSNPSNKLEDILNILKNTGPNSLSYNANCEDGYFPLRYFLENVTSSEDLNTYLNYYAITLNEAFTLSQFVKGLNTLLTLKLVLAWYQFFETKMLEYVHTQADYDKVEQLVVHIPDVKLEEKFLDYYTQCTEKITVTLLSKFTRVENLEKLKTILSLNGSRDSTFDFEEFVNLAVKCIQNNKLCVLAPLLSQYYLSELSRTSWVKGMMPVIQNLQINPSEMKQLIEILLPRLTTLSLLDAVMTVSKLDQATVYSLVKDKIDNYISTEETVALALAVFPDMAAEIVPILLNKFLGDNHALQVALTIASYSAKKYSEQVYQQIKNNFAAYPSPLSDKTFTLIKPFDHRRAAGENFKELIKCFPEHLDEIFDSLKEHIVDLSNKYTLTTLYAAFPTHIDAINEIMTPIILTSEDLTKLIDENYQTEADNALILNFCKPKFKLIRDINILGSILNHFDPADFDELYQSLDAEWIKNLPQEDIPTLMCSVFTRFLPGTDEIHKAVKIALLFKPSLQILNAGAANDDLNSYSLRTVIIVLKSSEAYMLPGILNDTKNLSDFKRIYESPELAIFKTQYLFSISKLITLVQGLYNLIKGVLPNEFSNLDILYHSRSISSIKVQEEFIQEFFKMCDTDPVVKTAWDLAREPDSTKRINATYQACMDANPAQASNSSTSSPLIFIAANARNWTYDLNAAPPQEGSLQDRVIKVAMGKNI